MYFKSLNIILLAAIAMFFSSIQLNAAKGGKVKVKITGKEINISGEYDCGKCGDYFYPLKNKGIIFEAKIDSWKLQLANSEHRNPGSQVMKNTDVTILLNGPGKYYGYDNVKPEGEIVFSEDFKSATVKVKLKNVTNRKDTVELEATFNCN